MISTMRDLIDYVFMLAAFIFQHYNRHNLRALLNDTLEFVRENREQFGCTISGATEKYKNLLCISIAVLFVKMLMFLITVYFLVDSSNMSLIVIFIASFPKWVMLFVGNEYFFGILTLKFHIKIFNDLLGKALNRSNLVTSEKLTMLNNDLELCDLLEKITELHSKLFKMYTKFSGMFQFQMLLAVVSNFFALMVEMFYIFHLTFFSIINLHSPKSDYLYYLAVTLISIRCFDIYFHLKCSNVTTNIDAMNQKLVASLNSYQRDVRLKNCVRFCETSKIILRLLN